MKLAGTALPDFAFPVIAWAPVADPSDSGIRAFSNPHELTRTYRPKVDTRLGWTFVDLEGRCWEAVSSKVVGRAEPWPKSWLPRFFHVSDHKEYGPEACSGASWFPWGMC